uniref:Uncharacterized protein MANES_17G111000 n=1 Tax=Rhizophora mucronata TaxID=61149 RepID=A0A2P2KE15_RHIMU
MPYQGIGQGNISSLTDKPSYNACLSPMDKQMCHRSTTPPLSYVTDRTPQPQASIPQTHLHFFHYLHQNPTRTFFSSSCYNTSSYSYPSPNRPFLGRVFGRPTNQGPVQGPDSGQSQAPNRVWSLGHVAGGSGQERTEWGG